MMMIIAYTKLAFLILLYQTVFENFRLFFHVPGWEMSKTQRESLPLLRNCRDPKES